MITIFITLDNLTITNMNNDNFIPQEPIDLDFQTPDDVEQELRRREYKDLDILLAELNTI
jgi:hypothetical protein